jgi:hypothetical protein
MSLRQENLEAAKYQAKPRRLNFQARRRHNSIQV